VASKVGADCEVALTGCTGVSARKSGAATWTTWAGCFVDLGFLAGADEEVVGGETTADVADDEAVVPALDGVVVCFEDEDFVALCCVVLCCVALC
jgi:hypothetical protein